MKKRLDLLLVERKIFLTRSNAQVHILSGEVFVNSEKVLVSSKLIDIEAKIEIKLLKDNFVSRGGLKLEKAIKSFDINPEGMICLDVGASTGGFTDCLLKKGASKVYCVDVGYGQLDYKLRNNTKVINFEKLNARYIKKDLINDEIDIIVMDVSFISITKFEDFFKEFSSKTNTFLGLIKPQFELTPEKIGKNGIVRNQSYRDQAIKRVCTFVNSFYDNISGPIESPIKGTKGNVEYLIAGKN